MTNIYITKNDHKKLIKLINEKLPNNDSTRSLLSQDNHEVKMFSDQICTYTFIDDIAQALCYFLDYQNKGIYHLVGSTSCSPYEMCLQVASVFNLDKKLISPSSLADFISSQPQGSRPWQKKLITSNQKAKDLGLEFKTLKEGLEEIKKQQESANL
jgi:dTDP-4-dehydrorhamnose reductase